MVVIDLDRFVLVAVAVLPVEAPDGCCERYELSGAVPDFEDMMDNFEILYVVVDYYKIH